MRAGSVLQVPTIAAGAGERVELRDVLLLSDGDKITVGSPTVADALVVAEVVEHGKSRKVTNFKFKAKVRYRRKRGHRQGFTALRVREIQVGGKVVAEHKQTARAEAPAATPVTASAPASPAAEAPASAPVPAGRTARRRTAAAPETEDTSVTEGMEEITGAEAVEEVAEAENTESESGTPTGRTRRRRTQE